MDLINLGPGLLTSMAQSEFDLEDLDEIVEICVETLVGAVFEMRLSNQETIASIKMRLQRLEGIPKHQMHLLYLGEELPDSASLAECSVESGATLKLVLSLRGGPINTRRVPLPSNSAASQRNSHLEDLVRQSREQLEDKAPANGQVTVLLFREGDQINLYHVLERPDGSFTPISTDSGSIKNLMMHDADDEDESERVKENAITMTKMSDLKEQLENLHMKKSEKKKKAKRRDHSGRSSRQRKSSSKSKKKPHPLVLSKKNPTSFQRQLSKTVALPPIQSKDATVTEDDFSSSATTVLALPQTTSSSEKPRSSLHKSLSTSGHQLPSLKSGTVPEWLQKHHLSSSTSNPSSSNNNTNHGKAEEAKRNSTIDVIDLQLKPEEASVEVLRTRRTQKLITTDVSALTEVQNPLVGRMRRESVASRSVISNDSGDTSNSASTGLRSLNEVKPGSRRASEDSVGTDSSSRPRKPILHGRRSRNQDDSLTVSISKSSSRPGSKLSATRFKTRPKSRQKSAKRKKTPKPRCNDPGCRKKLNITNGFSCRCQKVFCAKHRHPESHDCTFNYKEAGRKALEEAVPVVTFPKLPKI